jgi:hypothetical protein
MQAKEEKIKKSSVKGIIARWRMKYGFDHACYQKMYIDLYKRINEYGRETNKRINRNKE